MRQKLCLCQTSNIFQQEGKKNFSTPTTVLDDELDPSESESESELEFEIEGMHTEGVDWIQVGLERNICNLGNAYDYLDKLAVRACCATANFRRCTLRAQQEFPKLKSVVEVRASHKRNLL